MRARVRSLFACLEAKGWTLALAESCTGGLIAKTITDLPGASKVFKGSLVVYSNDAKMRLLGVPARTIERFGAVSRQTAEGLARGACRVFGADIALGITGIAGPGGGTKVKPVGLVWFALCGGGRVLSRRFVFEGSRTEVRRQAVRKAMELLGEFCGD